MAEPIDALLAERRQAMRDAYHRVLPVGELFYNRFEKAKELAAGDGSSVYDACVVMGDVRIGKGVWVGPYTILDGSAAPLVLEDYATIASGAYLYTHDNALQRVSGGKNKAAGAPVTIGAYSFIASHATIAPGVRVGERCIVAAYSYVKQDVPAYTIVAGIPAKPIGWLEAAEDGTLTPRYHRREGQQE